MIAAVVRKELKTLSRSGVFLSLACAILALLVAASALSAQRLSTLERERHAAEHIDDEVWEGQGVRNPHSAAHFARYAFKPIGSLAAFDPGITDYAGLAVWMEAHYQNPAVFRRAEDLGSAAQFANLSPAWVLQVIAPLFLFLILFGTISGEREDGTLRQVAATGAPPKSLLIGKLAGACAAIGIVTVPALLLGLWATWSATSDTALADTGLRSLGLVLLYALYFAGLGGLALGVSALCRDRRSALLTLIAIWAISFVVLPRLAGALAATLYPQPEAPALTAELKNVSGAFNNDLAHQKKVEADLLKTYGVDTVKELPVDFVGYRLQQSEEYANPLFDAFYGRINALHASQQHVLDLLSLVSPVMAIERLSAGLAGTDRLHQIDFTQAAEDHRRKMVKQLNNDLFLNGAKVKGRYVADEALWKTVPNLSYSAPPFASFGGQYLGSFLVLVVYGVLGLAFAVAMTRRAQTRVTA